MTSSPYGNPAFRRLLVGWTVSSLGDSALFLTLAIWAKDLTGSNGAAGLVFLALGLPILFSPLLGHLVDRVRRRPLLIVVNALAAVGVLVLLLVDDVGQLWLLYVVAVGYGLVGILTGAAQSGVLKDLLPDDQLDSANATLTTIDQGLRLISPLLGAGLYAVWGGPALAVLASATFVLAVVALCTVRLTESAVEPSARGAFLVDVMAGFRHIRSVPILWRIVVACAVSFGVVGFFDSVIFAVVDEGLGKDPAFFGVLMSVQGGGSILGGITAVRLLRRVGAVRTVGIALALFAAGSTTVLTTSTTLVVIGIFCAGAAIPWLVVAMATTRQRATPPRLQGRSAAAANMALSLPQLASIAVGAALVDVVDYRWLGAAAVVVLSVTAATLLLARSPVGSTYPAVTVPKEPVRSPTAALTAPKEPVR